MKKTVLNLLTVLGQIISLFLMETVWRQKPLAILGTEKFTILSLDPKTEVEFTWVYAFDPDNSDQKNRLRDISFSELDFSDGWQRSEDGMKTAAVGETLAFRYPLISRAGYEFCFRVIGGKAVIEHTMPGNREIISQDSLTDDEIVPVCGLKKDAFGFRFPVYCLYFSLLLTILFLYLSGKERQCCFFPETNRIPFQFQLLKVIGIVLAIVNRDQSHVLICNASFPSNSFYVFLFVFLSGYFYEEARGQSLVKCLWEKGKKILIPLYGWQIIYAGITAFLARIGRYPLGETLHFKSLFLAPVYAAAESDPVSPVWFLVPLFMIETGAAVIGKLRGSSRDGKVKDWMLSLLSLALGTLGMCLAARGINPGWGLAGIRILCLIPFYQLGYLYKKYLEKRDTASHPVYLAAVFLVLYLLWYAKSVYPQAGFCCEYFIKITAAAFWLRLTRILTLPEYQSQEE